MKLSKISNSEIRCVCPAKINRFLAVTGAREDGFHNLVSYVEKIELYDTLTVKLREDGIRFSCSDSRLETEDNLVLKAVELYKSKGLVRGGLDIHLEKSIPSGAGLGGGSSDAVGMLKILGEFFGGEEHWQAMAEALGSDCPLFLTEGPVEMRGHGERVTSAEYAFNGDVTAVIKPHFGIETPWAFGQLRLADGYMSEEEAEKLLAEGKAFNSFQGLVFEKYPVYRLLEEALQQPLYLSGTGSACYLLEKAPEGVGEIVTDLLGPEAFVVEV